MYKKLSNAAWEEAINKYYSDNHDLTIKDYCSENNLNKSQFYYHKKRLSNKNKKAPVFQAIKLDDNTKVIKKKTQNFETSVDVRIVIGAASISIPVSETALINSIIKALI